jgi:hypothetical protein
MLHVRWRWGRAPNLGRVQRCWRDAACPMALGAGAQPWRPAYADRSASNARAGTEVCWLRISPGRAEVLAEPAGAALGLGWCEGRL